MSVAFSEGHACHARSEGRACHARRTRIDYQTLFTGPDKQVPPRADATSGSLREMQIGGAIVLGDRSSIRFLRPQPTHLPNVLQRSMMIPQSNPYDVTKMFVCFFPT